MRILHVVTLVDENGSYGGPLRVAINQLSEFQALGHEVMLVAGVRDDASAARTSVNGIPFKGFKARKFVPAAGFAGLGAPTLWGWLRGNVSEFDIVHVHVARDLVTMPAARLAMSAGTPVVLQTHGMVDASSKPLASVFDFALTRRVLRQASRILALTPYERDDVGEVYPPAALKAKILPNGVPESSAHADPATSQDVLFLARLAPRKRPEVFVRMAQLLARQFPDASFSLVGQDEGALEVVQSLIAEDNAGGRIRYEGPLPPELTGERMAKASVYVLPSTAEPYAMSVLEAMSTGLPCVIRHDSGLAASVRDAGGYVVANDDDFVSPVRTLLSNPKLRSRIGSQSAQYVAERNSIRAVASEILREYEDAISHATS